MGNIKRVLHICGDMNKSGIETFIMNIYENINKEKVQFDFLLTSSGKNDDEDKILSLGGKIYRISHRKPNYFKHLKDLNNFFTTNSQYDVIHCHASDVTDIPYIIAAKKYGVRKIIYHGHNNKSYHPILNFLFKLFYQANIKNYANHYFACSYFASDYVFGKYIDRSEIKVINNAISTEKFIYNEQMRQRVRNEFNLSDRFVIGHVGRISTQKNHTFLLDIFSEVYKENSNATLMLIGEGKQRNNVEKKIADLGLQNNVLLTGTRLDVNDLMQAMDVFLFPSLHEGLGIALIEAQASGLHTITSADVVPQLAKVTNLLEYVSLEKPAAYWAKQILRYSNGYERENMQKEVKRAGFDIKELAHWFEGFYLS